MISESTILFFIALLRTTDRNRDVSDGILPTSAIGVSGDCIAYRGCVKYWSWSVAAVFSDGRPTRHFRGGHGLFPPESRREDQRRKKMRRKRSLFHRKCRPLQRCLNSSYSRRRFKEATGSFLLAGGALVPANCRRPADYFGIVAGCLWDFVIIRHVRPSNEDPATGSDFKAPASDPRLTLLTPWAGRQPLSTGSRESEKQWIRNAPNDRRLSWAENYTLAISGTT